jgi:hypothetical protein
MSMPTEGKPNLQDAQIVCDIFHRAAELNRNSAMRSGSVVDLPDEGKLLVTGDMHDHRVNFIKAFRFAQLRQNDDHHLLLQELIHGEKLVNGLDLSYRTSAEAAALQIRYPGRVHLLLSNHELAQVNGEDISKHGVSSVEAFQAGLEYVFGGGGEQVEQAFAEWVLSLPLGVRCPNGIMCTHSLPNARRKDVFDPMVMFRELTELDLAGPQGSAHLLVWGRSIPQNWADDLATLWNSDLFVLGHQQAEMGYELHGETMLILASDHDHGVMLPINLARNYSRAEMVDALIPFAAVSNGVNHR